MAITVERLRRIEVWDKWAAAGGVRLAIVPDATVVRASSSVATPEQLTVTLPLNSAAAPYVTSGAIIRIDQDDTPTFDEWKIVEGPNDNDEEALRSVVAEPLSQRDLVDCDVVRRIDSDGAVVMDFESVGLTPLEHLNAWVLPALVRGGLSWVSAGVITPTKRLDLAFSWDTPRSVLKRIQDQTDTELALRRIVGGYAIDLITEIGSSAPIADVRFDRNLRPGTRRTLDPSQQATRVFPRGASEDGGYATMARAVWLVAAIAGLVVTLADPAGGAGPIQFDGQLAGLNGTTQAYLRKANGTLTQVTASSASAQTVTVASVAGMVVGDLVGFRADAAGGDMVWLDSPLDRAAYGLKVGMVEQSDVPSTNNLLKNAAMRSWPGAVNVPPTNWTKVGGGTVDRQSAAPYTRTGGYSIHRVGANDGDGVISDAVAVSLSALRPWVSGYAGLWVVSGQVRVELVFTTATGLVTQPLPPDFATNSVLGQWEDLGVAGIDALALGATAVRLRVVQHGATPADFYLDYGQVTESPAQMPFAESSGGTRLWQAANEKLRTDGAPLVSYDVPIADLAALDPVTWGADCRITVGGKVRITDPKLALAVVARVIEVTRDYLVPGATRLTLSNKPDDLSGRMSRPKAPPRAIPDTGENTGNEALYGLVDFKVIAEDATSATFGWTRGALVSEVWAGYATFAEPYYSDPWPEVRGAMSPLIGVDSITVPKPPEGSKTYLQVEPRLADLTPGEVRQAEINPEATQAPFIELDDIETGTTGTQWWRITERGLRVTAVEVQTQIGAAPVSPWGPPTRGPGAASAVRGGVLGAGEYEHDVPLDPSRLSWIMPRISLANDEPPIVLGPFGFDRDKNPNLLSVQVVGTVITIIADSDTRSIKVSNSGGTWIYQADGTNLIVDVSKTGTNGAAGLGSSSSDSYLIEARSDPTADVDGSTLIDSRTVVIGGSSAPPPSAAWDTPGVTVNAPALGQSTIVITLKATAAPVGWTAAVFIKVGSGAFVDRTADLDTPLTAPPTVNTDYGYDTGFVRISGGLNAILHTYAIRADLKDGGGVVQDSRTVYTSFYSSEAV